MASDNPSGKDISPATPSLNTQQLREIESFDDALALLQETYGSEALETADKALGDGFALTHNKDQFLGVPLVFVWWTASDGSYPDPETGELRKFVSARIVTKTGGKFVITDGSSGISEQLMRYGAETGKNFLVARKGLRVSRYKNEYTDEGTTYYVDTSAPE